MRCVVAAVLMTAACLSGQGPTDLWEQLALIERPESGNYVETQRKFAAFIPKIRDACHDFETDRDAADRVVFAWNEIREMGFQDTLFQTTVGLQVLTTGVSQAVGGPTACMELVTSYITGRETGNALQVSLGLIKVAETMAALEGQEQPAPTEMIGGWECSGRQAINTSQRLLLTHTGQRLVLAFMIPNGALGAGLPDRVDIRVDRGETDTIRTLNNNPEIELDEAVANKLRRGHSAYIAVWSDDGSMHSHRPSLTGFTRAHDCVMQLRQVPPESATGNQGTTAIGDREWKKHDQEIQVLAGRVTALREALRLTIYGLSAPISQISSDPEATQEDIRNVLAEGFRKLAEQFSETEAKNDDAKVRIRAGTKLLGELANSLAN